MITGSLGGTRVWVAGNDVAGHYAAWLLAGLGAKVTVSCRGGSEGLSAVSQWLLTYCEVCGSGDVSAEIDVLDDQIDVLIVDVGEQLVADVARAIERKASTRPLLVSVLVSPYGSYGPLAERRASTSQLQARSGLLAATGDRDGPPLLAGGDVVAMGIGANACLAVMLGLWRRLETGRGARTEVSGLETVFGMQSSRVMTYTECGLVYRRAPADHLLNFVPCLDGFVNIYLTFTPIEEFVQFLGADFNELPGEVYAENDKTRQFAHPELLKLVKRVLADRTRDELVERGVEWRIPVTQAFTPTDHLSDGHLAARDYYETVEIDGAPVRTPAHPFTSALWRTNHPEDSTGPSDSRSAGSDPAVVKVGPTSRLPLDGIRVLEFGLAWAAPMAGQILAMYGAEVIKVESPTRLDTARVLPLLDLEVTDPWWDHSANYQPVNNGKLHLGLDLKAPGGDDVLRQLIMATDLVVTNFSVRALRDLGIDADAVAAVNPACSTVNATGYGLTGPYRERGAYGTGMEGAVGLAGVTGGSLGPVRSPLLHPDISTSLHSVIALVAALIERRRTGRGSAVDLGQFELGSLAVARLAIEAQLAERGSMSPPPAPDILLPCRGDDQWVSVTMSGERDRMEELVGVFDVVDAEALAWWTLNDVVERVSSLTADLDKYVVADRLQADGIAAEPVLFYDEACEQAHLADRDYFVRWENKHFGRRLSVGRWIRFHDTDIARLDGVHPFGADNRDVLMRILGRSSGFAAELENAATIGPGPVDAPRPPWGSSPLDWMLAERIIWRVNADYRERMGLAGDAATDG